MCQKNIEAACIGKGVKAAFWDKNTQKLSVKYSPKKTSADNILGRVAAAGYDTEKQQANPAAYLALPACCHYREQPNSH